MIDRFRLLIFTFIAVCSLQALSPAYGGRYVAMMSDGERIEGDALSAWEKSDDRPHLNGKPLFEGAIDGNKPFMRYLRDTTLQPGPLPNAAVEFWGGDVAPGVVQRFVDQDAKSYSGDPAYFVTEPGFRIRNQNTAENFSLRLSAESVRRIIWERTGQRYQPSTAIFRDGRRLAYRSARFTGQSVNLLTEKGLQRIGFDELAELHFPAADHWQKILADAAALAPDGETILLQINTTDGACITGSLARFRAESSGNSRDPARWSHALQPSWSLDPIWISHADIWLRRAFRPYEVPLSRLLPTSVVSTSMLSKGAAAWRANLNGRGEAPRHDGQPFGYGFGMNGGGKLTFTAPKMACSFQTSVGIDDAVGEGGCVKGRIYVDKSKRWESGFLLGGGEIGNSGELKIAAGAKQFTLEIDPAHHGRPAGADPLDIRDLANWLDPLITLDNDAVKVRLAELTPQQLAGMSGWKLQEASDSQTQWSLHWDDFNKPEKFQLAATMPADAAWRRKLKVGENDRWLLLFADYNPKLGAKPKIEIRMNGEAVAEFETPVYDAGQIDPPPLAFPLSEYLGAEVELSVVTLESEAPVRWRTLRVAPRQPALFELLEDSGKMVRVDKGGIEKEDKHVAVWSDEQPHAGMKSLQLKGAGEYRLDFDNPIRLRENPAWGEYRLLRFAFRKIGGGRISLELNHAEPVEQALRYDAGVGEAVQGEAKRIWIQKLPEEWIVMTVDPIKDFGQLDLTGITLSAVDGEVAYFDHIHLGRSRDDFRSLDASKSPESANRLARRALAEETLAKGLPSTVAITLADDRLASGVIISKDGYILTAGHVIVEPNEEVTVHLPSGEALAAVTKGVCRELDVAVVKIKEGNDFPFVEMNNAEDLARNGMYIGVTKQAPFDPKAETAAHVTRLRRIFRGMVWTTVAVPNWRAGGPLLDETGKLIGVQVRNSEFGGFLYVRITQVAPILDRLKKGEVWGDWASGSGPVLGVVIQSVNEGAKVIEVSPDSPAAKAGVKVGDIFTRVEGRSVVSLADIYEQLANNNPGDKIEIEILRGEKTEKQKVALLPRVP